MALQIERGMTFQSVADGCELLVIKAPAQPVDLRYGGHPFGETDGDPYARMIESGFDAGTLQGRRYFSEEHGVEVLCTNGGDGSISVGTTLLQLKPHRPMPASPNDSVIERRPFPGERGYSVESPQMGS